MVWTPALLAEAAHGEVLSGNAEAEIHAIATDTRKLAPGYCFIALTGENHDGHDFVEDAVRKGAGAVIVSRWEWQLPDGCAVITVSDTLTALGEIARFHRFRYDIPVIAVTGSNGKTSTKEMIASIFARSRKVLKNKGNFNNLIGLPLTLLELDGEHRIAIVEMGINVPGEMERLVRIGSPDVGLITNVHPAHLEGLESLDRIVEEKGKLWKALRPECLAVVNLDDSRLSGFAAGIDARKITYSRTDPSADIRPVGPISISEGKTSFRIAAGGVEIPVCLPLMGLHHAQNALAAAATAFAMGVSPADIEAGLADFEPAGQRMRCTRLRNGRVLVDDTYNANPGSLLAAVEAVLAACSGRPFVAVLGEMRELGRNSAALHFNMGGKIGAAGPSILVTLGPMGTEIQKGARNAGLDEAVCFHAQSHDQAVEYLRTRLPDSAWILVKGSRGMTMERVVEGIIADDCKCRDNMIEKVTA